MCYKFQLQNSVKMNSGLNCTSMAIVLDAETFSIESFLIRKFEDIKGQNI